MKLDEELKIVLSLDFIELDMSFASTKSLLNYLAKVTQSYETVVFQEIGVREEKLSILWGKGCSAL